MQPSLAATNQNLHPVNTNNWFTLTVVANSYVGFCYWAGIQILVKFFDQSYCERSVKRGLRLGIIEAYLVGPLKLLGAIYSHNVETFHAARKLLCDFIIFPL